MAESLCRQLNNGNKVQVWFSNVSTRLSLNKSYIRNEEKLPDISTESLT
jgi:hypothetical protein